MKENSIKNERSSIKEDIKDIEKYISFTSKRENFSHDTDWNWNKDLANKIEHILSDYKRVLKENEELKETYKSEKKMKNEYVKLYQDLLLKENVIPIQKVIEYLDNQQKQWIEDRELKESDSEIIFARNFLQELIKEEEEKHKENV